MQIGCNKDLVCLSAEILCQLVGTAPWNKDAWCSFQSFCIHSPSLLLSFSVFIFHHISISLSNFSSFLFFLFLLLLFHALCLWGLPVAQQSYDAHQLVVPWLQMWLMTLVTSSRSFVALSHWRLSSRDEKDSSGCWLKRSECPDEHPLKRWLNPPGKRVRDMVNNLNSSSVGRDSLEYKPAWLRSTVCMLVSLTKICWKTAM